jgi:nucleoside-diphosphate-sugar epimerase
MRVLFIGGTGNISTACSQLALDRGMELHLLNRARRPVQLRGARVLTADINDERAVAGALAGGTFDVVVNFIAFAPTDIERDLRLFSGRCGQYLFVSSASCYRKPCLRPITEDVPLENPVSPYSLRKIACERRLALATAERAPGLSWTIVRPSLTYDSAIPLPLAGGAPWTLVDRMLRGRPVVVHGDGCVPFTVTHSADFAVGLVGLLGNPAAIGESFHITGDEVLTWDEIHRLVGAAAGAEPSIVHMASEDIATLLPERAASLLGDKAHALVFDNSKIKAAVPDFAQRIPFAEGIRRTIAWFRADPARMVVSEAVEAEIERLLSAREALRRAGAPPGTGAAEVSRY